MCRATTQQRIKDHTKFDKLPKDFPNRARYINQLAVLREDRNMCDYDHMATASDLALGSTISLTLVRDFIADTTAYLKSKGLKLRKDNEHRN